LFGFAQHIRFCAPGGPTPQQVSLVFLQQRPALFGLPGSLQQNWVAGSQHAPFPPHFSQHLPFLHRCFAVQHV
jgi:hypothetical protein